MTFSLHSMGTLVVHIDESWNFAEGPLGGRSCTALKGMVWESDVFNASAVWTNGTYRNGPEIGAPEIRAMLRTSDGAMIYLEYLVRIHLPTHSLPLGTAEKSPAVMTGRLEVEDGFPQYEWLNRTQIVGEGTLDKVAYTQSYETHVLRWESDTGPTR